MSGAGGKDGPLARCRAALGWWGGSDGGDGGHGKVPGPGRDSDQKRDAKDQDVGHRCPPPRAPANRSAISIAPDALDLPPVSAAKVKIR